MLLGSGVVTISLAVAVCCSEVATKSREIHRPLVSNTRNSQSTETHHGNIDTSWLRHSSHPGVAQVGLEWWPKQQHFRQTHLDHLDHLDHVGIRIVDTCCEGVMLVTSLVHDMPDMLFAASCTIHPAGPEVAQSRATWRLFTTVVDVESRDSQQFNLCYVG